MANIPTGMAQYMARFGEQSIACSQYAMTKLGVDRTHCFIKIEEYVILCIPFQLGFKRSIFLASLSKEELGFFQRFVNSIVGLSISLNPDKRPEPVKFFIRCTLHTIGQMKGRENVGLFVLDFKSNPDELVSMMGSYLEAQERIKLQYEDYGDNAIRMTPEIAKIMGYNMYATIIEPNKEPRRIQIFNLSSKYIEHLEGVGAPHRPLGTNVTYQIFFQKFRVSTAGVINETSTFTQGLIRTKSTLTMSPELIEIIDDYWYASKEKNP